VSGVVVDTSVWIDFLAGRPAAGLVESLSYGGAVLPPVVAAELISGARHPSDRKRIEDLIADLVFFEAPLEHWIRAGELRLMLRGKGVAISTPDAHIAQCALDLDALLLTRDAVFTRVAKFTRLRVRADGQV
jgi:hypothetical protein